ncbi:DNA-formamidopyrimidine glycosylase family protein [Streptomyces sp. B1866]|uniref:DNA-formamidopyrimidine glycosylase family protein n=1 Tax=Streptomyces sp. B1866 TaxID=3075431 RepID=UPI00288E6E5D|nr:DNA-formamidopyrimidine glycosylase family protein [Streptomyces sp. B1866]MDT3399663.1 DNA-formamidopyrimidine glycosylase family protein [Streptomyces sp. B1866]
MPEGDTVWQAARRLHEALSGSPLVRSDLRVPRLATADLSGRRVVEVFPRGKHLLARVEGGLTLHSHLRMDGAWRVYGPGERWRGGPGHEIRAVLATAERTAVGYRLPVLELLRTADEGRVVGHLGPDLLGPDWDPDEALRRLLADPGRPLGDALLDQRNLAGIGNVYRSELCFLLRVSPWLPAGDLPAPERLPALAKKLLEANKTRVARVTTPDDRRDRRLWVYGRPGRPCRRCGTPIRHARQGRAGEERATFWCPACQPPPVRRQP